MSEIRFGAMILNFMSNVGKLETFQHVHRAGTARIEFMKSVH